MSISAIVEIVKSFLSVLASWFKLKVKAKEEEKETNRAEWLRRWKQAILEGNKNEIETLLSIRRDALGSDIPAGVSIGGDVDTEKGRGVDSRESPNP